MSAYELKQFNHTNLQQVLELADSIYDGVDPSKYPDFRVGFDIDQVKEREKFFRMFMLDPKKFKNFSQRACWGVYKNNKLISAVGVRRLPHSPSWCFAWILSPSMGIKFVPMFREIVTELCNIHEAIGLNEFFLTYPEDREDPYSRIMLFLREKYYTFVEMTIPAKTLTHYSLVNELLGRTLHPHNMNFRRYILRRTDTEAPSEGGKAIRNNRRINGN